MFQYFAEEPVQISTPARPTARCTLNLVEDDLMPSAIVDMQSEPDTEKHAAYSWRTYAIV